MDKNTYNIKQNKKFDFFNFIYSHFFLYVILSTIFINLTIEILGRHSFKGGLLYLFQTPMVFLYNSLIIFASLLMTYLFRRRVLSTFIISMVWILLGIINGAVLTFRVTPFTGQDFKLIKNGFSLISKYMTPVQIVFLAISTIVVVGIIAKIVFKSSKYVSKTNNKIMIPVVSGMLGLLILLTKVNVQAEIISNNFGNIADAYKDYGVPYCFVSSVVGTGIKRPLDYSQESMKEIMASSGEDSYPDESQRPNILFLQLESFVDPTIIRGLSFSEDPTPNFRMLKDKYSTGYLTVPSIGAGTANTEFEIITGMSMRYFGPGEYPYKTILREKVAESTPYNLKDLGYTTHAIHNHAGGFYGRNTVFSRLGFDTFTSSEYMNINEYTPNGWAKDSILTEKIMNAMISTEGQDFVQTITVQGHGSYSGEIEYTPEIIVSGVEEEKQGSYEYYVNQMHETDDFIGDLIEALSDYDEDVVLVMYGDHLPSLGLKAEDMESNSEFNTEYVIWDNMGLEKEVKDLTSFQLSAEVLNRLGIHKGTITKFHQARKDSFTYLADLNKLQYDMLYGEQYVYSGRLPYKRTRINMGVEKIRISEISMKNDDTYISGENFTKSCNLYLNDEKVDTIYVDDKTLILEDRSLVHGDKVNIKVQSESGYTLSATNDFHYSESINEMYLPY
ncbi:LTA synthase family protein [Tissierella creatinini]|nr:LTA synthase family protein [Tissierella creatinini]TJX58944.1 LTA synthase family protein [Soehngenia saccharolytica]